MVLARDFQWNSGEGFRWAELKVPTQGKTGFTLLTPGQTGVRFTNTLDELEAAGNRVLFNGSGVAVGDFDGDGLPDIFLCGLDTPNALYRNLGDFKFQDVTAAAGLTFPGKFYRGAVFADINGDGRLDLLVTTTGHGVLCFLNAGQGRFQDITEAAGTASRYGSVSLTLADIDGNGTLDLYVANNRTDDIRDRGQVNLRMVNGQVTVPAAYTNRLVFLNGRLEEYGEPSQLYLNDGHGNFSAVAWTQGAFVDEAGANLVRAPLDWGLTAAFHDLNGDGWPDLYVCNDYWTPDRIWMNDGHGHFRAADKRAIRHTSASSMGIAFSDIDRDGHDDFFVVDMLSRDPRLRKRHLLAQAPAPPVPGVWDDRPQVMRNTLFHSRGDGSFEEIADFAGLSAAEWAWQPLFLDVDLDGYEDLLVTAGYPRDVQDMDAERLISSRQHSWSAYTNQVARQKAFTEERMVHSRLYPKRDAPVVAFRNLGNLHFADVTAIWGTSEPGVHQGIALADFDGDGDLDIVVNNLGTPAGIYRNDTVAPRIAVRLRGLSPNTQGIGSKVFLRGGATSVQSQEIHSGGSYLSGSEPLAVFAVGTNRNAMSLEVVWRSGRVNIVPDVGANRLYEIIEPASPVPAASPIRPSPAPLFREVSSVLGHRHTDEAYDDFARQPLLPRRLSQLGPGVAWFDWDGDGHDDLIVGSGKGGVLSHFRGDGKGGFKPVLDGVLTNLVERDQTGVIGFRDATGKGSVWVGVANYEDPAPRGHAVLRYGPGAATLEESLPGSESSTGPMALADLGGEGNLALFVGGRVLAGRYPEPADSRLYRRKADSWQLDEAARPALEKVGMVSGAVWSDLDGDGQPELVLACEWGRIRVFQCASGHFEEMTARYGLDRYTGWWAGVTTGDLDGDGRMDIVASNWGLNSPYAASPEYPARIEYADLGDRGVVDIVETEIDPATGAVTPRRNLNSLGASLPFLRQRFPSYRSFSEATLSEVLGGESPRFRHLEATTLASTAFLNRGDHFEARELPSSAQFSSAFGVCVADCDGDGNEDVFLSQNFFAVQPETARLDAGRGLWLRGDGRGHFTPMSGADSGIVVYGEQRGAAVADFNEDGRVDLVVTQNAGETKLFINTGARPGLRVRLAGSPGNSTGIGAVMRLIFGSKMGPAREIHAGSGYWSQDSAVQILATPEVPSRLWIRWPGGRITQTDLPLGAFEVTVDSTGKIAGWTKRPAG